MGLPAGFVSERVPGAGLTLHAVHNSRQNDTRRAIVFLHGFPEFWIAWREVFVHLADDYRIIAPDQRGFNLSDAPAGREHYKTRLMVADLLSVAGHFLGDAPFILAGHDWGASVAYAAAIGAPERISRLVIANGVHPVCFQRALIDDPAQRAASQYFHLLTADAAPQRMAEDNYRRTLSMFERFSHTPWLNESVRAEYREAWSQPGRLAAMLHWYASSPIVVPREADDTGKTDAQKTALAPLYSGTADRFSVTMPHLLIWGERDQALLPSATGGLEAFAPGLERLSLPDADHWLLHTHGEAIAGAMRGFVER